MSQQLIVFTNNGQTLKFDHVTNFAYTSTGFTFEYFGNSTQVSRKAVFNNTSVAGYAVSDEDEDDYNPDAVFVKGPDEDDLARIKTKSESEHKTIGFYK